MYFCFLFLFVMEQLYFQVMLMNMFILSIWEACKRIVCGYRGRVYIYIMSLQVW
jgi:hypothetical protein